jgi:large subunit ribosomal protein L22
MEATAKLRYLRIAPRKVRAVVDAVRGRKVEDALNALRFIPRSSAVPVAKLLRSAVANAEQKSKGSVDVDDLVVKKIHVDQGPTMRRFLARAMGRATRINKKTSHVTVVLSDR